MFNYPRFLHFFWSWFTEWYSRSPSVFPCLWPCGRTFLMQKFGREKRSRTDLMYFLFSVVSSRKKCPHVRQTMSACQYVRHALHCPFGSTSSISHNSVFPAALITSCDSLLKGLNARCCWRSLWSACRWGWFSIFWIKFWTLTPCDRFTVEFGTPGMLNSIFSSSVARLNSLSALNDAM